MDIFLGAGLLMFLAGHALFRTISAVDGCAEDKAAERAERLLREVHVDNEYERKLLAQVVSPRQIKIKFDDIGGLEKMKEGLKAAVILPIQRPELFTRGLLASPCKGVLLFGPPGTGKTMLAKALACEAGANFINISAATINSKWVGESEKLAKAVFSLASKIAPSIIFIDEVDSLFGTRDNQSWNRWLRLVQTEFMTMWDGLTTNQNERVVVLGATNRPYDMDEAFLRRFSRRFLVDLPDTANRLKILRAILGTEEIDAGLDLSEVAAITSGYSGSDLRNLCVAAAYRPLFDFLSQEKETEEEAVGMWPSAAAESREAELDQLGPASLQFDATPPRPRRCQWPKVAVALRPITLTDFVAAKTEACASRAETSAAAEALREWNQTFGDSAAAMGPAKTLSYFT